MEKLDFNWLDLFRILCDQPAELSKGRHRGRSAKYLDITGGLRRKKHLRKQSSE